MLSVIQDNTYVCGFVQNGLDNHQWQTVNIVLSAQLEIKNDFHKDASARISGEQVWDRSLNLKIQVY